MLLFVLGALIMIIGLLVGIFIGAAITSGSTKNDF